MPCGGDALRICVGQRELLTGLTNQVIRFLACASDYPEARIPAIARGRADSHEGRRLMHGRPRRRVTFGAAPYASNEQQEHSNRNLHRALDSLMLRTSYTRRASALGSWLICSFP